MNPPPVLVAAPAAACDELATLGFTAVCRVERLTPNRGVAALVHGVPVALFLLDDGTLHALDNVDPFCGSGIISRGLVGDVGGEATVASPMYKQRFSLSSGVCVDEPTVGLARHEARCVDGVVHVRLCTRP